MRPLLAEKVDLDKVKFPILVSPKYDGFRCLVHPAMGPITRSLKEIPNMYVRGKLSEWGLNNLDGELLTYTGGKLDDFNTVQSKLSTRSGMPDFKFMVFDCFLNRMKPFTARYSEASFQVNTFNPRVEMVPHAEVTDLESLNEVYDKYVNDGWEGLMIRDPFGIYKAGRSTVNEGILLKMKPLDDAEGKIIGKVERRHNANEATTNALGYKERSSHKSGMVGNDSLGAFVVEWSGTQFELGTGFTEDDRQKYWKADVEGLTVTFAYQGVGKHGRPRFPRFKGIRKDL